MPNPSEPHDFKAREGENANRQASTSGFHLGQAIGGRYEIISRIGGGGMGIVYRVNQVYLKKEFALKTIETGQLSESAVRRFQQEARTTFSLDHPSIISVYDFGVLEDGSPFLVMELLHGETLGDCLKRCGSLPIEQALPIFVQICFGLAYAHEAGIVHRDIKPNNIMLIQEQPLGAEGSVKILDFGIAKLTSHEGGEIQALTRTGDIFGSPLYMSPEQCTGLKVDHRADIYSLGCVFFEALTGTSPFMGENALSTMLKHQNDKPPTLREASMGGKFPQALEEIVATLLEKSPDRRYQNLGVLAHDLGALLRGAPIVSEADRGGASSKARPTSNRGTAGAPANSFTSKSSPQTISLSINQFIALLVGAALLFVLLGFGLNSLLNHNVDRNAAQNPTHNSANNSANDLALKQQEDKNAQVDFRDSGLPAAQTTNEITETDKQTEAEYQRFGSITSAVGSGKNSGERIIIFPETPIGVIDSAEMVDGKMQLKKSVEASGMVSLPDKSIYHLVVGGSFPASFYHPIILSKIGTNELNRLTISRPELFLKDKEISDKQLEDATIKILKIAKTWTKLAYVELHGIPCTTAIVAALNSITKLDSLSLNDSAFVGHHVLKDLALPNLQNFVLRRCANINDVLYDLQKCKKLRILQFTRGSFAKDLDPSAFEQLQLSVIVIDKVEGLTDEMLKSILRIKGLKGITIKDKLTPEQDALLKQAVTNHIAVDHILEASDKQK